MKRRFSSLRAMFTLTTGLVVSVAQAQTPSAPSTLDRSVLPIPEPKLTPITELAARNAKAPPRFEVKTPEGAPNVLIVLIDDMGFGQSSAFGGPINMPTLERTNATLVGRPDLMAGRTSLTVFEGMKGMSENVFINTKNRSHSITANVEVSDGGANGVILAQAGRFGGFSLYLNYGKPTYAYNFLGGAVAHWWSCSCPLAPALRGEG